MTFPVVPENELIFPLTDEAGPCTNPPELVKIADPLTSAVVQTKLMVFARLKSMLDEFADNTEVAEMENVDVFMICPVVELKTAICPSALLAGPVTIGLLFDNTFVATKLMVFATLKSMLDELALNTDVAEMENVDVLMTCPLVPEKRQT
jgi:hypothetical protein